MANDLNQVKIEGRLVDAPKIKFLENGSRVATMRLANNRYFKGRDDPGVEGEKRILRRAGMEQPC